jgi:hypothetical protein
MTTKKECSDYWANWVGGKSKLGIDEAKADYAKKCGMYDEKELNCIRINSQLQSAIQLEGTKSLSPYESVNFSPPITNIYRKQFADNNCTQLIEQYRQAELGSVVDKFTNLDKVRIESESIYERNQRIFFGGLVLVAGIVILTMFSKKK